MIEAGAGCAVSAAAAFMAWAVRGRSSEVFGSSVWRGPRNRAAVALTFDDGPSESTPRLLEVLARHGAPATFFQCGANVERLPAVARAVREAGHEIGNHSHTHPYFHFRRERFIEEELRRAQQAIRDSTGASPVWMRAPYGVRWFGLKEAQRRLGLTGVMWTVIGYDWKFRADAIVRRVLSRAGNGSIICLHDGRRLDVDPPVRETVEAVDRLIPAIRARGLRLETVSQLLCPTN
jgi:peptidoglycan/xylan/chitin deacetylase (PgdA/CDA1 family)